MSTHDEFRQEVAYFLNEIENLKREGEGDFDRPPRNAEHAKRAAVWSETVRIGLSFYLHDGYQVLERVPVSVHQLHEIGDEINKIPMIEKWRRGESLTWYDCDFGLSVLAARLQEMLEYLPPASSGHSKTAKEVKKLTPSAKERQASKRRTRLTRSRKNLSPSERRADTVAKVIEELNVLRPHMSGAESDYARLAKEHARFLTFRVAREHADLREKVLNVQDHRRHIRLAQEIVARKSGVELETVRQDWKKYKPQKYRRNQG